MSKITIMYKTRDGKLFYSEKAAINYEAKLKPSARELATKHNLKVKESSDTIDWLTGKRIDVND